MEPLIAGTLCEHFVMWVRGRGRLMSYSASAGPDLLHSNTVYAEGISRAPLRSLLLPLKHPYYLRKARTVSPNPKCICIYTDTVTSPHVGLGIWRLGRGIQGRGEGEREGEKGKTRRENEKVKEED